MAKIRVGLTAKQFEARQQDRKWAEMDRRRKLTEFQRQAEDVRLMSRLHMKSAQGLKDAVDKLFAAAFADKEPDHDA